MWERLVGQTRAVDMLRHAIERPVHAYLLVGPPGSGVDDAARYLALGLVGAVDDARAEQLIFRRMHPDVVEVEPEGTFFLARQADDVIDEAMRSPVEGERKVVILRDIDRMNETSANRLLKTFEEPPGRTVFVLTTAVPDEVLPTIRSRCQRVAFAPLSEDDMQRWAKDALAVKALGGEEGGPGAAWSALSKDDREWLFSFAAGAPGMALLALETGLVEWRRTLAPMLAELDKGRFPIDLGPAMSKLADEWAAAWVDRPGNENASKDAANKAAARQLFRLLADHYRTRLRAGAADVEKAARPLRAIDLIVEAERQADSNVAQQFVFENLAAQLAAG
jgi:hypothetical protein